MILRTISVGSDYKFESNIQGMNANGCYDGTAMFGLGTPYNRFISMNTTFKENSGQLIIDKLSGYYEGSYFLSDKKFIIDDFDLNKMRKDVSIQSKSLFIHFKVKDDTFTFRHLKINIDGKEYYFKTKQAHLKNIKGVTTYTVNPYQTTVMFTKDKIRDYMTFTLQFELPIECYNQGISAMQIVEFRTSNNCKIIIDIDKETILFPLPSKYVLKYKSKIKSNVETEYPDMYYSNPLNYMRNFNLLSPYTQFNKWYSLNLYISKDPTLASFIPNISIVYENAANTFAKLQDPNMSNRIISLGCVYYYDDVTDKNGPFFIRYKNHPVLPIFSNHTIYVENRYKFVTNETIPSEIADLVQQGNNINNSDDIDPDGGDEYIDPNTTTEPDKIEGEDKLTDEIKGNISLIGLSFPTELLLTQHDYDFGTNCIMHDRPDLIEYKVFDRANWGNADFDEIYHSRVKSNEPLIADCEYPFIIWNEKDEYIKNIDKLALTDNLTFEWIETTGAVESYIRFTQNMKLKDQWTGTWVGFNYTRGRVAIVQHSTTELQLGDNFLLPIVLIKTPTVISDTIDIDTTEDMTFNLSQYIAINHDQFHARTDWIISKSNDPDDIDNYVVNIIDDIDNLTSLTINALQLQSNVDLYIIARYKSTYVTSDWCITKFNTKYQIIRPTETIVNKWNAPNIAISGITYMQLPEGDMGFITSDYSTKTIYIHDGKSANIRNQFSAPGDGIITGITNNNGNLISCNSSTNIIYIHDGISDVIVDSFNSPGTSIADITIDDNGNLISCDGDTAKFYIHDGISDTITAQFDSPESNPRGITYFYESLYITSTNTDKIYRIDSTDFSGDAIPITEINSPSTYPSGLSHTNTTVISTDLDDRVIYEHATII